MPRIVVIGGANTDIFGMPAGTFVPADSNPGTVRFSFGGVARNIAENLARLGAAVQLVTALGDDHASRMLESHCREAGIGLDHALFVPGAAGSAYLAVLDEHGALMAAVSDMWALAALTPEAVDEALEGYAAPDALVVDTNIDAAAIARACERFPGVPVFADCVSATKAPRILGSLARISGLHVNALEAEVLTGVAVAGEPDGAARAAAALHRLGVDRVFITEGPEGVYVSDPATSARVGAVPVDVVNVTGAGDAFVAGAIWGTLDSMSALDAARFGVAAAAITLTSTATVAPEISDASVRSLAEEVLS